MANNAESHLHIKTTKPGQLIHSDVCGPMQVNSLGGKRYFVIFKDDFSNYTYVF
jgi:hypothetical protein